MSEYSHTHEKIEEIVKQAREIYDLEKRNTYISRACSENQSCIETVKSDLLALDQTTEEFIDKIGSILPEIKYDDELLIGKKIGDYVLKEKLGQGISNVFRGEKQVDGKFKDYAIKLINQKYADRLFSQELANLNKITQHRNIAKFIKSGFDESHNYHYIVFQYIQGLSITDSCERRKNSLTKRLAFFLEICEAVKSLHEDCEIVHRDIKPANILIQYHPDLPEMPFLIDFGISNPLKKISEKKSELTGLPALTPEYASPEQFSNKTSAASDIYSLGVVLYELLTSYRPYYFHNDDWESMKKVVCEAKPEPPSSVIHKDDINEICRRRKCDIKTFEQFLTGDIDRIILKCLSKEPKDRYETVDELIDELKSFLKEWKKPKSVTPLNDRSSFNIIPSKVLIPSGIFGFAIGLLTIIIHFSLNFLIKTNTLSLAQSVPIEADKNPERYLVQSFLCAIFIIILVITIFTSFKDNKNKVFESAIARDSFHQFLKGLMTISITWFWLYLYFYLVLYLGKNKYENAVAQTTIDFLNACTSTAFFYVFLIMDMKSVPSEKNPKRNRNFLITFTCIILISILIVLLTGGGRFNPEFRIGVYVSGLFAAISMLYFFARLGSHHLNVNRWSLTLLYSYASIQVIGPKLVDFGKTVKATEILEKYPDILKNEEIKNIIIDKSREITEQYPDAFFILLLLFKVYLFSVLIKWLLDGKFLRYFNLASSYIEAARTKSNVQ